MKEVVITSKVVGREGAGVPAKIGQGSTVDLSAYLLKAIWDKVWEIRTDSTGKEYIFGKLPVVTQYGITMYAGDGGDIDLPSLYAGLPIDNTTIYWENGVLKAVGSSGGGVADSVAWGNVTGKPSWITDTKPTYAYSEITGTPDLTKYALQTDIPSLSGYATESWVIGKGYALDADLDALSVIVGNKADKTELAKYIPISGYTEVSGEKNFTGGLKVNGSPIYYDATNKYWKLEGDLLVTGGVTMYANEGTYTPSTIMDALLYDDTTLGINSEGKLYVKGGTGGGLDITALQNYLTQNSYLNITEGDGRYLKLSGGVISGTSAEILGIDRVSGSNAYVSFRNNGVIRGYLGVNTEEQPVFADRTGTAYTIWHAGNDGAGSGLDADMLDGVQGYMYARWIGDDGTFDLNTTRNGVRAGKLFNASNAANSNSSYRGFLEYGSNGYTAQFNSDSANNLYYRWCENGTWGSWETIAFTASNVASATKIQTARTIWGQSFDGTGNVSGALSDVTGITFKDAYYGLVIDSFGNFSFKKPSSTTAADWSFKDSSGNKLMIINNSGNVGIGTTSPQQKLDVIGKVKADALYLTRSNGAVAFTIAEESGTNGYNIIAGGGTSYIRFYTNYTSGAEERMRLDSYGNLGIGTNLPSYKLHVVGNAYVRDGISMARSSDNSNAFFIGKEDSSSQNLQIVNSSGSGKIIFRTNRNSSLGDHFILQQGSTILYDSLTINGYAKANYYDVSTTRQASLFGSYTLGCGMYGSSIQHSVSDGYTLPALMWSAKSPNGNSSQFSIMSYHPSGKTGYLIIGVAKNGTRTAFIEVQGDGLIQAGGDFLASGGITMYSDQRKKTILRNVELSLKDVANAPLIEHYYNSDDKKTTHVGSIAQYWAGMNDWFCKLDNEGYYTMEIQNAALASAISVARELDRYENKTDKTIKKLKKRICELEEEVERLKAN